MTPDLRLPVGAKWGSAYARKIAENLARVRQAYAYWKEALRPIGLNVFHAEDSEAMQLTLYLPVERADRLPVLRDRIHLTKGLDKKNVRLIEQPGCLVSAEEIAQHIDKQGSVGSLFEDLEAFEISASDPIVRYDVAQVARGIQYARELTDVIRRYEFCRRNEKEFKIPVHEFLALYRQEAALAIPPSKDSYPYAPVIHTQSGKCRTPNVYHWDGSFLRPGFNPVFIEGLRIPTRGPKDARQFMFAVHHLISFGLDSIVDPSLKICDELEEFTTRAAEHDPQIRAVKQRWENQLSPVLDRYFKNDSERKLFSSLLLGSFMAQLDLQSKTPSVRELIDKGLQNFKSLVDNHKPHRRKRTDGGYDIYLLSDDNASETYQCLRFQAMWWKSRSRPETLLAWRDRGSFSPSGFQRFSPFLTYLRFNSGDAIFIGSLFRAVDKLDKLRKYWQRHRSELGESFLEALDKSGYNRPLLTSLRSERKFWVSKSVQTESTWRHVGLLKAIEEGGAPDSLAWLRLGATRTASVADKAWFKRGQNNNDRMAKAARALVEVLLAQRLFRPLALALEFTPVRYLVDNGIVSKAGDWPYHPLANSHSFERLRLAFKYFHGGASLPAPPDK